MCSSATNFYPGSVLTIVYYLPQCCVHTSAPLQMLLLFMYTPVKKLQQLLLILHTFAPFAQACPCLNVAPFDCCFLSALFVVRT